MKDVKIVIGANYGDEGKGLTARHFATKAKNSVIILDNGTAQRGHTIDYLNGSRHVFHHFGSAALDAVPTYYGPDFLLHPMTYTREWQELCGLVLNGAYSSWCYVITPFDILIDHMTEDYIQLLKGEREYGSCGFGSWCATDRIKAGNGIAISTLTLNDHNYYFWMEQIWNYCLSILAERKVDIEKLSKYKEFFEKDSIKKKRLINHFKSDLDFFCAHNEKMEFDDLWKLKDNFVFEMGQGLGLDQNVDNDWHTTSNTGIINPYKLLNPMEDFSAEVCYVSRTYLTRHGEGPLEENVKKKEINETMVDKTNVPNDFQGSLRYGYLEKLEQTKRIEKDWSFVAEDKRFTQAKVLTHYNEFTPDNEFSKYYSDNKFEIKER